MPRTLQVRDIDDDVHEDLRRRAAEEGRSVPELLRREIRRLVAVPSMARWLEETRSRSSDVEHGDVIASLDAMRGAWPDAGR